MKTKKRGPWELVIVDHDKKQYAVTGPITDDERWNERICEEQKKGRALNCQSLDMDKAHTLSDWAKEQGLTLVDVRTILGRP